jgi:chromosome segregation ATPase
LEKTQLDLDKTKADLAQTKVELEDEKISAEQIRLELKATQTKEVELTANLKDLQAEVVKKNELATALQGEMQGLTANIAAQQEQMGQKDESLGAMQQQLKEKKQALSKAQAEAQDLTGRLEDLSDKQREAAILLLASRVLTAAVDEVIPDGEMDAIKRNKLMRGLKQFIKIKSNEISLAELADYDYVKAMAYELQQSMEQDASKVDHVSFEFNRGKILKEGRLRYEIRSELEKAVQSVKDARPIAPPVHMGVIPDVVVQSVGYTQLAASSESVVTTLSGPSSR